VSLLYNPTLQLIEAAKIVLSTQVGCSRLLTTQDRHYRCVLQWSQQYENAEQIRLAESSSMKYSRKCSTPRWVRI
jgi:hypothetical protein